MYLSKFWVSKIGSGQTGYHLDCQDYILCRAPAVQKKLPFLLLTILHPRCIKHAGQLENVNVPMAKGADDLKAYKE